MNKLVFLILMMALSSPAFAMAKKPTGYYNNPEAQRINACYGSVISGCISEAVAAGIPTSQWWIKDGAIAQCQKAKCL